LDLKKAFDIVNKDLLLHKLRLYGCDLSTIKWFKSYLKNRHQFVVHNNSVSNVTSPALSVAQGSCLAPELFGHFMNDITFLKLFGVIYIFADNISIIISAKTYAELQLKIDSYLRLIFGWFQKNKLVINYQKSNYMVMGCSKKDPNLLLSLGQNNLKRVNETKILDVIFDNDLRFDNHINNICKSISNRISFLSRLRYCLPESALNTVYKALVLR
jgi:hypothetical protein